MDIHGLEGLTEFVDGLEKGVEIYAAFLKKATLEQEDREALKRERGFNDTTIELCQFVSCSPRNRQIIEELQKTYSEVELVESGLLQITDNGVVPCSQLLGIYNKKNQFVNNICIPYFNSEGQPFFLRPHKFGFKDKGINIYVPVRKLDPSKPLILAESEFKAAAAIQFGFPAIGVPGIHSFAASHFTRLKDLIVEMGVKDFVVMYDNEIKSNPLFSNYKPDVIKQWDTQWRAVDIARKLTESLPSLSVKIATLPETWMVEGKIDIDGALAAGKTAAEFRNVVHKAQLWNDYLDQLPTVARKIIHRKIFKEDYLKKSPIRKISQMGSKEGPIGYYIRREIKVEKEKIPVWEPVTNFTMDIYKTIIDGEDYVREIVFHNQDGTDSDPVLCTKGMNLQRDFKAWAWSRGDYHFEGSQEDLNKIWRLEGILCDGREIVRPEQIGYVTSTSEPLWLFGNVLVKQDGTMITANGSDGIMWDGLVGYLPRSNREEDKKITKSNNTLGKIPTINLDSEVQFGLAELKAVAKQIEQIYDNKAVTLALGWIVACLFSDEIYRKYASFPILFIAGKRESGKTTLGAWLMSLVGQPITDKSSDSIDSSPAGVIRNLAWFSNLPYWLDEYRNDMTTKKWESFFRNVYQRQAPAKGTLGKHVRANDINAGLIVSGEETPQDNALFSRCVIIQLRKRKKEDNPAFRKVESLRAQNLLSRLLLEVIKQRSKLLPVILDAIDGCKKRLLKEKVGDRMALNFAIAAICYDIVFLSGEDTEVRRQYLDWVVKESCRKEEEKEREHMLAVFMDDIMTFHEDLRPFYMVYTQEKEPKGKRRIAISFPTFYNAWVKEARKKGMETFSKNTILSYIREETYYIDDNVVKRIQGKPVRSLILSLDPQDNPPDALVYLAATVSESTDDLTKTVGIAAPPAEEKTDDLF